jgi:predicted methyltransferase
MKLVVLSHFQAKIALKARGMGMNTVTLSLDLGISATQLPLDARGILLKDDMVLNWEEVEQIAKSTSGCFMMETGSLQAIQFFSELTGRVYSLYPTPGAPTMLVSGIPMHRIKGTDPFQDTLDKVQAIKPVVGQVLDTATGLGYTAIQAARTAEHVTTIELDPVALQVCRRNPWSQELFDNPKITQLVGDSFEVVAELEAGRFTRVIHDPPAFSLAGDLYSGEFYQELYRVMSNRSKLFHYIGDPESKSGRRITTGVIRRLEQTGFRQVRRVPRAFGVMAVK